MAESRRSFLRTAGLGVAGLSLGSSFPGLSPSGWSGAEGSRPNVLFVALDDLNDWIEPLGGHPQTRTPNLTRLARQGVNFTHSYCASPSCLPSRTALLTGLHAYRTGVYTNYQYWREVIPTAQTLPQYFAGHGYWAAGAGKIFHNDQPDPASWDDYFPSKQKHMPDDIRPKPGATVSMPAFKDMYMDFDWAPLDVQDADMGDYKSASWIIDQLRKPHDKPFFLACGLYRPHNPWYVPRKYYDMFPLETLQLPRCLEHDLDDVGPRAVEIAYRGGGYHRHVIEAGLWKQAVQGYLAAIAFADAQLGRLLDALDSSPYATNTIVVAWSDHGWQLGEKEHWRKFALWENVVRAVTMIRVPSGVPGLAEGSRAGTRCDRVVSLMDLFPTLVDLCGLPAKPGLDGRSLVPLLRDPQRAWDYPALTTYDFAEFSVRVEGWRYTRYIDDSEELYDEVADPEEWRNLASEPKYREIKARLARHIPATQAPIAETSYKLMPHHIKPFRSKEEYRAFKAAEKRGEVQLPARAPGPWYLQLHDY